MFFSVPPAERLAAATRLLDTVAGSATSGARLVTLRESRFTSITELLAAAEGQTVPSDLAKLYVVACAISATVPTRPEPVQVTDAPSVDIFFFFWLLAFSP